MVNNSTQKPRRRKATDWPRKPYPDFPLSPHPSDKWQKKIRGKIVYFGRWANRVNGVLVRIDGDGWQEALESYNAQAADLHAGDGPGIAQDRDRRLARSTWPSHAPCKRPTTTRDFSR